ncbi:hypothetical protein [Aestuariibaculum sediminum]|uniref:Phage holin family protein n=1 Tax=Aestuariibaculum sediminum TaxID=2770637 RepID=A0A8J6Q6K2_9FLAO|nr:hypothetical protein [Aestuariibaculum sediminum]MBD0830855.1 hypothetical protein [Aestuariibaculum sediminum]
MRILDVLNEKSQEALQYGDDYLKSTEKFIKLKVFEQLSLTISLLVKFLIIAGLGFLGLSFFAVSGALALGNVLNSLPLACLIIGASLMFLMILIYVFRKSIDNNVIGKLSNNFFNSENDES